MKLRGEVWKTEILCYKWQLSRCVYGRPWSSREDTIPALDWGPVWQKRCRLGGTDVPSICRKAKVAEEEAAQAGEERSKAWKVSITGVERERRSEVPTDDSASKESSTPADDPSPAC